MTLPFTTDWYLNRLAHHEWEVCQKAIRVLARRGSVETLVNKGLLDRRDKVRVAAVEALGMIGGHEAIEALASKGLADENSDVSGAAVGALERIGGTEAIEVLANLGLTHQVDYVRKCAAIALGGLGDRRAVDTLVEALPTKDYIPNGLTEHAAYVLSDLGDRRAIDTLVKRLTYYDNYGPDHRTKEALDRLDVSDQRLVDGYMEVLSDDGYFEHIKSRLWTHPGPGGNLKINIAECNRVRLNALNALTELGDARATLVIEQVLSNPEINEDVRRAAVRALDRLRNQC